MSQSSSRIVLRMCVGAALSVGMIALAQAQPGQASTQAQSSSPAAAKPAVPAADMQETLYAFGAALANNLRDFRFSAEETKIVQDAFMEVSGGRAPKVNIEKIMPRIQALYGERQQLTLTEEKAAGAAYLAKVAKEPGAMQLDSGIVMSTLQPGKGAKPTGEDTVKVTFNGRLIDGTEFDSTREQGGEPTVLPLNAMIPCWTQAIRHMQVGSKSRLVCPSDMAHGDSGAMPKIKPGATLIYEVELLDIVKAQSEEKKSSGQS